MPNLRSASPLVLSISFSCLALLVSGCASTPPGDDATCEELDYGVHDPVEPMNRGVFAFNLALDNYAVAPVSRGYTHLPIFFQTGVHNFVANFGEPKVFINDILQGNGQRSVNTFGRFVINSTVGLLGVIDVSGKIGIERHKADFGQTFGVWNIADGPIVELPLLGTSNLRDATGKLLSFAVDPLGSNSDTVETLSTIDTVGGIVDGRARLLPLTDELKLKSDYYVELRNAVALRRALFVAQGKSGLSGLPSSQCKSNQPNDE